MAGKILSGRALPPGLCAIILAVLLVSSVAALTRLNVNNSPEVYLPASAPSVAINRQLRKLFPTDQVLIALFQGDVYSDRFLTGLESVTERMRKDPLVERALSVFTLDHIGGTADGFNVGPLLDPHKFAKLSVKARRSRVLHDRFAPGMVASRDGKALALILRPVKLDQSWQRVALEASLRGAIKDAGLDRYLSAVGGQVAVYTAEFQSMVRDTLIFVPTAFVIGGGLLWIMFRRMIAVTMGALAMAVVASGTVAIIALSGKPYTLITAMIPPLMAALTAALLIHLFNALSLAGDLGLDGPARIAWACRHIERPARFTALTTAAGLASLALSPIPPIRAFGLASAGGTVLIYLVCVVLLPPVIARLDRRPWPRRGGGLGWADRFVRLSARAGIRYAGPVAAFTIAVLLLSIPLLRGVTVETNMLKFFSEHQPISRSTRLIEDKLSGVTTLEVAFKGTERDMLKDPHRLAQLKTIQNRIRALPHVDRVLSMTDIVEEMNWAFHGEDDRYRRLPQSRNLVSQYLLIYDGRDLYDLVDRDFEQTRLLLSLDVHGADEINAFMAKVRQILRANPVKGLQWHISGFGRLFADQVRLLIRGQVLSLWGAVILIFGLLVVVWRSVSASLLCMLPNIAPILVIFAIMGAAGIWLDMATAMIASVTVGIAVDDTIHLYHAYRSRLAAGARPVWALRRAYRSAGRAVVVTSVILGVQFLVLTASQFRPTMEFGLLTTIGLISALLFDLLFLPAILTLLAAWRDWRDRRTGRGRGAGLL